MASVYLFSITSEGANQTKNSLKLEERLLQIK